ncbi:MAG: hypothetical protein GY847_26110 [Proteobacteria bacterium]|nr:hypothetical protein [Pseudomonadota bacterium]
MIDTYALMARIENLEADEKAIVEELVERLGQGREIYGPWQVDDKRNYPQEALFEVFDALHYCAAELVRLSRKDKERRDECIG